MLHETISHLLAERGRGSKLALADYLGIARTTLDDYLAGRTYMTSDNIEKTARFFGVPVGYLFGETSGPSSPEYNERNVAKILQKHTKILHKIANKLQIENE